MKAKFKKGDTVICIQRIETAQNVYDEVEDRIIIDNPSFYNFYSFCYSLVK